MTATATSAGICEDDDELRGVLRRALEREGLSVRATASGTEAVRAFGDDPPDVLVLDIGLPDADGRDVCQALRARGVHCPVLFLTARDALPDRLSGFHAGGDDYLTKPFALAELLVRVNALLVRGRSPASPDPESRQLHRRPGGARDPPRRPARRPDADRVPIARRSGRASRTGGPAREPDRRRVARRSDRARQHPRRLRRPHPPQAAQCRRRRDHPHRARRRLPAAVSFRARLLLVSLATLAVGLGALLVGGNLLLAARVHAETDRLLQARSDAQIAALHVSDRGVRVRKVVNDHLLDREAWVFDGDRVIERPSSVSPRLDARAVELGRGGKTATADGPGDVRLRAEPVVVRGSNRVVGAVVVGVSQESFERLQRVVLIGSLVVAGLVLVAGGLTIRAAIDGALRPVAQMTERARDWGAHDLDRRFDLGEPHDELTGLAATLDGLLARIAASRRHEQHFASEVAHELRTPLAGIRGRAELALTAQGPHGDAERDEALRSVIDQVSRLDKTIDTLLAVARGDLEPATGTTDLAALAGTIDGVIVHAPGGLPLAEGDSAVIRQALAPLVDNARRHARRDVTLVLSADGGRVRVTVRDDGPGLDPTLGERAFDPGARGGDEPDAGAGLGLALARRLARACGGDVTIGPGPGGLIPYSFHLWIRQEMILFRRITL